MKSLLFLLLLLTTQLSAQVTDIVIDDKKVNKLDFNMPVRKAKALLGNDYSMRQKKGTTCHYNSSSYDVTKLLNYKKLGLTLQFDLTTKNKRASTFKKCRLAYISIKDSSLISVNNIKLWDDTTKIVNTFGRNFRFKESWWRDQKQYDLQYGGEGIWFILDTNMRIKEITIDSKKIIYGKKEEEK